jgi:hypothetical protein
MKCILALIGFFLYLHVHTQVLIPANTRSDIRLIQEDCSKNQGVPSKEVTDRFAIHRLKGDYYVSFLGEKREGFLRSDLAVKGIISASEVGAVVSLRIPLIMLDRIHELKGLRSLQLAGKIKPYVDYSGTQLKAEPPHLSLDLPHGYTGKNVLIGLSGWGFDYTSPVFDDSLRRFTRILAAWDQFKNCGPPPSGYSYGTEYISEPEFRDAGTDTAETYGQSAFGTHASHVSGGSGAGMPYRGIAQSSHFLFATLLPDEASALDAWEWMYQKSIMESKRLVIHVSWGVYQIGTMDGTSLLNQAIDSYTTLGVVFCGSAGNNGAINAHIRKNFSNDSIRSMISFYRDIKYPNVWGQTIYAWGEPGNSFEFGLQFFNSSGNTLIKQTPFYSTASNVNPVDKICVFGKDTIFYSLSCDDSHPHNGKPQMRCRVKNESSLKVLLIARASSGIVHFWNVTESNEELTNWGMPFLSSGFGTIEGDNKYGIFEPACSNNLIAVSAYSNPTHSGKESAAKGARASFSSVGPRYDEVLKPEIAAPGVNIISATSSYTYQTEKTLHSIDLNNRNYPFAAFSGTSCSSAIVAGVAALILEANPFLSSEQVRNVIFETAREDNFTGVIPINGSPFWGWGKVDAKIAVKLALVTVGSEKYVLEDDWTVFPNPVMNQLFFTLVDELPLRVQLIDSNDNIRLRSIQNSSVFVGDLLPGSYVIRLERKGRIQQSRFNKK